MRNKLTLFTVISSFRVEPARQDELVKLLAGAGESALKSQAEFVSASVYVDADGGRVTSCQQWQGTGKLSTMLDEWQSPAPVDELREMASLNWQVCVVSSPTRPPLRCLVDGQG